MATAITRHTYKIRPRPDAYGVILASGLSRPLGIVRKPTIMRDVYTAAQLCRATRIKVTDLEALLEAAAR